MKQIIVKGLMLIIILSLYLNSKSQSKLYDVVPIESKIYNQAHKIFVYTAHGKLPATSVLPVFYLTNISEEDSSFYVKLRDMVEEGNMPPMLIVGITKHDGKQKFIPAENLHDPKKIWIDFRSDDDNYFAFINKDVIPVIEKKYNCSKYKILSSNETSFTNYIINNHPAAFNAYVYERPFVWIENKNKFGITASNSKTVDIYYPDEYYLKYGKKPAWHEE